MISQPTFYLFKKYSSTFYDVSHIYMRHTHTHTHCCCGLDTIWICTQGIMLIFLSNTIGLLKGGV